MVEGKPSFPELRDGVLKQLADLGYSEITLQSYRNYYDRIDRYMQKRGIKEYTTDVGKEVLETKKNLTHSYYTQFELCIRRIDSYIAGIPFELTRHGAREEPPAVFSDVFEEYIKNCYECGNKESTVNAKKKPCISFLKYIEKEGCSDLSKLDGSLISRALLIFDNKGLYTYIRNFLLYLHKSGIMPRDLSFVVPKIIRPEVIPTTYTPEEIRKVELSVDRTTEIGKRNYAMLLLATRMGLRSGDIVSWDWHEINFSTGYIERMQEKTDNVLKLKMPDDVQQALREWKQEISYRNYEWVFPRIFPPYNRITTSSLRYYTGKYFLDAGIDVDGKRHGPHTFRSSLATSMVNDGVSYDVVRRILGHADPNVITHYAKTDIEKLRLCSIDPPEPRGLFKKFLSGEKYDEDV